jgi:hypothetical protein
MTERDKWQALCNMIGKRAAYDIAHAAEYDAKPFWSEFAIPQQRFTRYAWAAWIDQQCETTGRKS